MALDPIDYQRVAVLDAGSQYGKVIDRRLRELRVCSELVPLDTPASELAARYVGIILSGGPQSVYADGAPRCDPALFHGTVDLPVLGICYGLQLMIHECGGTIERTAEREDGRFPISFDPKCVLFSGIESSEDVNGESKSASRHITNVLLTHGDSVTSLADGFKVTAQSTHANIIAAISHENRKLYGVQFHPEVDLTDFGTLMLHNFLYKVCSCRGDYTPQCREEIAIKHIQDVVGDNNVLVLVSGGVDSSVCAALLLKALRPEKVHALHIDHGFMRKRESEKVVEALSQLGLNLRSVDASKRFADATTEIDGYISARLCNSISPEEKRKIVGDAFMHVSEEEIRKFGFNPNTCFLAQGTLRPDLIESASELASAKAEVIKTHHNDTNLVRLLRKKGRIVEPLKDYHKDEVRALGTELGLPDELVWRQPFPGPGLSIRILCATTPYLPTEFEKLSAGLRGISTDMIKAHVLPARTVGIQGDGRTYSSVVGLSTSGEPNWDDLFAMARSIPKLFHQVNRVVYIFGKQLDSVPLSITATHLRGEEIEMLQQADDIVNQTLLRYKLIRSLSQVPVILFPANFGQDDFRSIAIRTFITNDFMTGVAAAPGRDFPLQALHEMVNGILESVPRVARVCYDLTSKPPGTTEWE